MLKTTVQTIGNTTIVRCQGQITVGEDVAPLRDALDAAIWEVSAEAMILDLAAVRRVDAGGLGFLLELRRTAYTGSIRFKLINVRPKVQRILKLTGLDRVFEYCSAREMLCLLHFAQRAASGDHAGLLDGRGSEPWVLARQKAARSNGDDLAQAS
ncbi:MAG TPA: STAS domain-containing protein [Candidatus Eisenbacteria bacterium]|nr:STAS domain-containing protein [Candidatus Eisenbacteria bacterium]